jgi:NDP-sugar pyrophosphorylase family protein
MNGDILSLIDFSKLYTFALQNTSALTITIKKIITPYAFGNIHFEGSLVTGIEEKPDIITYALAGIYVMTPDIFNYIPEDTFYGMDLLIRDMLAKNKPISKYEIEEYWLDIGKIEDYTKAQEVYKTHFKES